MTPYIRKFYGPNDWGWVNVHLPILRVEDTCGLVMIDLDKHATVAAMVMDNVMPNSVQAHFVVTDNMALRHSFLEECFDLVFNEMGKKFMYGLVPGDNEKALAFNKHIGFTELARMPEAYADGIDYVIMELRKENCKHLPLEEAA
jgi:hypothetical protein